ncbi:MAG: cytochrome c assembly protein [Fibrobacteria bacterium]|jgi:ABC-type transport system involved in cytochrome c biogenesis permease subunit|nr:cytochrome c assembly protein [Fibrobacteria bacterium]
MKNPLHSLLLFLALCGLAAAPLRAQPPASGAPESMVSPDPEAHSEDDGHDHGSDEEAAEDIQPELGGEFTLLPEDLGRPSKGLNPRDVRAFGAVAVLHDGRIKPLETLARHLLLQWSGHDAYQGTPALAIFAQIVFAPEKTGDLKLFRIDNPEVAEALGITAEKKRRYSYRQIEPGLTKLQALSQRADSIEEAKRNLVEKEVLRTFGNVATYLNLTRSLQFALPSASLVIAVPETRNVLGLPGLAEGGPTVSFWELMERAPMMAQILDGIHEGGGEYSPVENEIVRLSRAMYLQSQTGMASPLRILPNPDQPGTWLSPSEVVATPGLMQRLNAEIGALAAMTSAYRAGDAAAFEARASALNASVRRLAAAEMEKTRFPLEILKNRVNPLFVSTVLFWISLFTGFLFFLFRHGGAASRWTYRITWTLSGLALFFLTAAIVARVLIMRRPPVTSLFETFPFVAAVSIAVALFLERRSRQGVALLSASLLGTLLLSIANRYAADGDTMQMLVAVLNSNFWLSTHVICITVGYAACALSGAIAHIRLVRGAWSPVPTPEQRASLREVDRMVYGTLCFGLLFSFIGTVLGGIWADQSWGRFWGWDPKENGALLIVIWCAILLHARHWGVIRETGVAAGAVLGAVIVSLAWQGVNLLNVGLHSYGFTSGAALKLFGYIGAEILFLLVVWLVTEIRKHKRPPEIS